jgi:chemotaxis regulatin CheY-phosphate phosphatase CheZ
VGETASQLQDQLGAAVRGEVAPLFDALHRFVDRRIAELSMEINATVQLVDYSETNLSGQLGRMQEQIATLVGTPSAATRNSGAELEAVVQATESAANRIMEAAEAIGDWLRTGARDAESVEAVAEKVNAIFEACSFQDITSQRIRRAIEHLQQVETMLTELAPVSSETAPVVRPAPDLAQDDVDRLFD